MYNYNGCIICLSLQDAVTKAQDKNIPISEHNTIIKESQSGNTPNPNSRPIQSNLKPETVYKKVVYSFDDRDLDNEARVETFSY
jgi:hypothetical protein